MKPAKSGSFLVGNPLGLDPMAEKPVILGLDFMAEGEFVEVATGDGIETGPVGLIHLKG